MIVNVDAGPGSAQPPRCRDVSRVARGCNDGPVAKRYLQVPELIVGFDTETTGLDVSVERAISYGFCEYRYGLPVWSEHYFVLPDRPISAGGPPGGRPPPP